MPPQSNPSLDECYELVEEVKKMYVTEEDKDAVLSLKQWHEDVFSTFEMREDHMAGLIRGEDASWHSKPAKRSSDGPSELRRDDGAHETS